MTHAHSTVQKNIRKMCLVISLSLLVTRVISSMTCFNSRLIYKHSFHLSLDRVDFHILALGLAFVALSDLIVNVKILNFSAIGLDGDLTDFLF
jgi:hypothetical protein